MRKMIVHLCKGCQETYKEEFGEDMGYTIPVKVVTVPKKNVIIGNDPTGHLTKNIKSLSILKSKGETIWQM